MIRKTVMLLSLMTFCIISTSLAKDQNKVLRPEALDKWTQVTISGDSVWFFKTGDNSSWADPQVSLEGWTPVQLKLSKDQMPADWSGLGWFIAKLRIDTALFGKEMAIHGNCHGAMELYLNGVQIGTAGQVGTNVSQELGAGYLKPVKFHFSDDAIQSLAIRYSNHTAKRFWNKSPSGMILLIGYPEQIFNASEKYLNIFSQEDNRFYAIFGFMSALALLHLILFAYYPSEKANLICALFFFAIAGIFLSGIIFSYENSPLENLYQIYLEGISMTAASAILPFFIYTVLKRKINWFPITILLLAVLTTALSMINTIVYKEYYYIFFHVSTTIGIGIILHARFKLKMKELNIILVLYFVSFLLLFPSLVDSVFGINMLWAKQPIYMNLSAIPAALGYSFFLARGVAMTNKSLSEKLIENEALSADKLRIEIEKQQLIEQQNIQLEKEVAQRTEELSQSLHTLKATQTQLIQQEKLASLGELTAGIAHEIQNPLNFVNNFSEINNELIDEMKEEMTAGNLEEALGIADDIKSNEEKIAHHGKRADEIVKGMLQHSRSSSGTKEPTDINALADEYFRLAYHGLRAKDKSFNATLQTDFDPNIGLINVVPQDIGRVLLNLINNAFHALPAKASATADVSNPEPTDHLAPKSPDLSAPLPPEGGKIYEPTVTIKTSLLKPPVAELSHKGEGKQVEALGDFGAKTVAISISDNGPGIPSHILDKIFQPFFTTKPTGQGTGLGLSLSYDIVKAHGGELKVETKVGEGSTFSIILPI